MVLSSFSSFTAAGIASCCAVFFTNPLEVVKTRLQLQGELQAAGAPKIYTSLGQSLKLVYQQEGFKGLQRGLGPAFIYQAVLNGTRVGLYEPARRKANELFGIDPAVQNYYVAVAVGTSTGMAGALLGSPFFLIKTRMQSYSPVFAVGTQTAYRSTLQAMAALHKEAGIKGLYRGVNAAVMRTGAGSSVQLPIYTFVKAKLAQYGGIPDGPSRHLAASVVAGLGVAVVMNPFDVIMTRMYNQTGNLYKSSMDCILKTIKSEGPAALYKGFAAQAMRVGPHTILVLMFMEQTTKLMQRLEDSLLSKSPLFAGNGTY